MRFHFTQISIALALAGCQKITQADQQAALECVRANLATLQKGDVNAVLATTHPKSQAYTWTPKLVGAIIQKYKLTYELEEARVEKTTADGIHVHFVQVTRKIEGPDDFLDNRVEGVHLLKRDGKAWKIWFTKFLQTRTLDGQPLPLNQPVQEDLNPPPAEAAPPAATPLPIDSQSAVPRATRP
jgi:uncharacterized protein YchJ